ncbi:hypothetical protein [Streptomyces sp. NPDC058280]|uniref:hypothetical protein n=1 Tax=Streptomyces sp. NPDC058280 TaxID=3346419 RepID=UPI0036E87B81
MVAESVLRGYLLEEVLAWLLRSSGYELLSEADEQEKDPARKVLAQRNNGLAVRGSGAWHQADALGQFLSSRSTLGLALAFPAAPFVLGLASENLYAFVNYSRQHPTHTVHLRRLPQAASHPVWQLCPAEDPSAYAMTFSLPDQVESWILAQDETVSSRTRWIKQRVLSTMTIYWLDGDHALTFQLRYAPAELGQ